MPDISMCSNSKCPSYKQCYRAMAVPSMHWQSYSVFNINPDTGRCDDFLELVQRVK